MWRPALPELPAAARILSLSTASGTIHNSADIVKAIALGADAVYIATAAMLAMGCHMCRTCQIGKCNWGIATQRPDLVARLDPIEASRRLVNLVNGWNHCSSRNSQSHGTASGGTFLRHRHARRKDVSSDGGAAL